MKNFILFGPPGIGKSTIIGILKTKGISALDLEDLYPNRIRFQIPGMVQGKVIAMADLNPKRKYLNCVKILLTAKQDVYDQRRSDRDTSRASDSKSQQKRHLVSQWKEGISYDYILDTTKLSAEKTADKIISIIRKEGDLSER